MGCAAYHSLSLAGSVEQRCAVHQITALYQCSQCQTNNSFELSMACPPLPLYCLMLSYSVRFQVYIKITFMCVHSRNHVHINGKQYPSRYTRVNRPRSRRRLSEANTEAHKLAFESLFVYLLQRVRWVRGGLLAACWATAWRESSCPSHKFLI